MRTITIRLPTTPVEDRVEALEALLIEKGVLDAAAMDEVIEYYEHQVGPMNGAKVVARAWVDPSYRERLLADGTAAIAELGFGGSRASTWWSSRTRPKSTMSSSARSARATRGRCSACRRTGTRARLPLSHGPRATAVLAEMGCAFADDVEIRVWDSSAEVRYLVLPMRPRAPRPLGGRPRRSGDPGFDDRRRPAVRPCDVLEAGFAEPSLPRSNGTPDLRRSVAGACARPRRPLGGGFRRSVGRLPSHLIAAIDDDDHRPYWDSWVIALDPFIAESEVLT